MARKHFIRSETTERIDPETGEILRTDVSKTVSVTLDDDDKFYMVFYNMTKQFYNIRSAKDIFLMSILAELAQYNTGKIDLSPKTREEICAELKLRPTHLSAGLRRLTDLGLITGGHGRYIINEANFWKGGGRERKELMRERDLEFRMRFRRVSLNDRDVQPEPIRIEFDNDNSGRP